MADCRGVTQIVVKKMAILKTTDGPGSRAAAGNASAGLVIRVATSRPGSAFPGVPARGPKSVETARPADPNW